MLPLQTIAMIMIIQLVRGDMKYRDNNRQDNHDRRDHNWHDHLHTANQGDHAAVDRLDRCSSVGLSPSYSDQPDHQHDSITIMMHTLYDMVVNNQIELTPWKLELMD